MSYKLVFNELPQFCNANGTPYSGGQLFTYVGGSTSTKMNTYRDSAGGTPNTNPIVLDSAGRIPYAIWIASGASLKLVLAPSTDTDPPTSPIWTLDGITGINDSSITVDQWIASGLTPTYIGVTQFSVSGDYTSTLEVGRRVKVTVTAGTKYGRITASSYAAGITTVTVTLDSGNLDAGLSAVSYGVLTSSNSSVPLLPTAIVSGLLDISASGAGQVAFPATQNPSSNANTLDDYEEGTWTPIDSSGGTLTFASVDANYEKIGRMVRAGCSFSYPVTADGNNTLVGGLPFTVKNSNGCRQGFVSATTEATAAHIYPVNNATTFPIVTSAAAAITNATMSGDSLVATALYPTT